MTENRYVFDNAVTAETGMRFSGLEELEVARHDVTADAIPAARYDLIHARLVLSHLPQRGDVMVRLVRALWPGGWPAPRLPSRSHSARSRT